MSPNGLRLVIEGISQADSSPTYAAAFECIGPKCEDICCSAWAIPVDRKTYAKYQLFPAERLGATVAAYVSVPDARAHDAVFAQINPRASGVCPFFAADFLCNIQREYGRELLSATCSSYPRALNRVEGRLEGALMLSCPEAARNVLLRPDATRVIAEMNSGAFRTDNFFTLAENGAGRIFKPYRHFGLVRGWVVEMLGDRMRPLWHRLLLIGSLCQKLSAIESEQGEEIVPAILADYRQVLGTTWGAAEMDAAPAQTRLKLNVLRRLTAVIPQDASCGVRFRQTYLEFIAGIAETESQSDLERYTVASAWHSRFFEGAPWALENYLLNYVHQHLFPFGRGVSARNGIFDEFLLLATQFFWLNGLLTGVAGCFGEAFGDTEVVHTVQSFCREVEHLTTVPAAVLEFLRENGMDNLAAMAALLKP